MVTSPADTPSDPEPQQIAVYRAYLQLQSIAENRYSGALAGRLLLCLGFGQRGAELALAAIIAGGAFLGIEPDPQRLKTAVRQGACDFMVNTLDEALRVLKNELRKRTPLSAGLLGDPATIVPAMVERGVQPDLIAIASDLESPETLDTLVGRGAQLLHFLDTGLLENGSPAEVQWTASNLQDLHRMDRIALDLLPPGDRVRRTWLERAPGYFYRRKPPARMLNLSSEERAHLLESLRREHDRATFQSPARLNWQDAGKAEQTVSLG